MPNVDTKAEAFQAASDLNKAHRLILDVWSKSESLPSPDLKEDLNIALTALEQQIAELSQHI